MRACMRKHIANPKTFFPIARCYFDTGRRRIGRVRVPAGRDTTS